jgi:transposase
MPRSGPRNVVRYSLEFKLTAVRLSELDGVKVKDVAESLAIHPFMLSRWRREVREGVLKRKRGGQPHFRDVTDEEVGRFAELRRAHRQLMEEHDILKKAIRFQSERKATSSDS